MKLYAKVAGYIVATLMWFGMIVPNLISAASDFGVAAGFLAGFVYPIFTYKLFKSEIETLKGLF